MTGLLIEIPDSTNELNIRGGGVDIRSTWTPPATRPTNVGANTWAFRSRETKTRNLSGRAGRITSDLFTAIGLALTDTCSGRKPMNSRLKSKP